MIDICCNLTHPALNSQLPNILECTRQADVQTMVVLGSNVEDSGAALKLANQYKNSLWACAGMHPHQVLWFCHISGRTKSGTLGLFL